MKVTKKMMNEIKSCCHDGHGASIFEDGTVMQSNNCNDIIAKKGKKGEWDYRLIYIDNPNIDMDELVDTIETALDYRRRTEK